MENITLSFVNGEILSPKTLLELKTARPITADKAQAAVVVKSGSKQLKVPINLKSETVIQVPTDSLTAGVYKLNVVELVDKEGQMLTHDASATFTISALKGTIPSELRAEHVVYLAVGELSTQRLAPGAAAPQGTTYLEIVKTTNRQTDEPRRLGFDAQGNAVDSDKELSKLQDRRFQKFGRLSETLFNKISSLKDIDTVDIQVWPVIDFDLQAYKKPEQGASEAPIPEEDALLKKISDNHLRAVESVGAEFKRVRRAPVVRVTTTVDKVRKLGLTDGVGLVDFEDKTAINDVIQSMAISRADNAKTHGQTLDGAGIKAAIYEAGPVDTTDLKYEKRYTDSPGTSNPPWHGRLTSAIIKNVKAAATGVSNGYAPKTLLYGANSTDIDAIGWAIDEGCTVISQSWHTNSDAVQGTMQPDDILKDLYATTRPFTFFSQAAGNYFTGDPDNITPIANEYVNHKTYNALSVGNHDDTATNMAGSSVFRNPTTTNGDRELPEICANGTTVSALEVVQANGTSFAAPAVAAAAIFLQQLDPTMKNWPEAIRAILLCAAGRKISGNTWWEDVSSLNDVGDGAGCLEVEIARQILQNRRDPANVAARNGWSIGNLDIKSDVDPKTGRAKYKYNMFAPFEPPLFGADPVRNFKVVLAWPSKVIATGNFPNVTTSSVLTVDLDLEVKDLTTGGIVGKSRSYDNSFEVVEFKGVAERKYEISILLDSVSNNSQMTWFALAWRSFKSGQE